MFQSSVPHHDTGRFESHRTFLPDEQYGLALDNLVKSCSDMLLLSPDGTKIFVGKRVVHPQPDWWFVGGRVFPGETPVDSCRRLLKRELNLDIESDRFRPVCTQSLAWGMRQQEPRRHGTTDAQVVLSVQMKEDELGNVSLDPAEYSECEWKDPDDILSGNFHPALKYAVSCLLTNQKLDRLKRLINDGGDDGDVAKLAREFVGMTDRNEVLLGEGEADYKLASKDLDYEATVTTRL